MGTYVHHKVIFVNKTAWNVYYHNVKLWKRYKFRFLLKLCLK